MKNILIRKNRWCIEVCLLSNPGEPRGYVRGISGVRRGTLGARWGYVRATLGVRKEYVWVMSVVFWGYDGGMSGVHYYRLLQINTG